MTLSIVDLQRLANLIINSSASQRYKIRKIINKCTFSEFNYEQFSCFSGLNCLQYYENDSIVSNVDVRSADATFGFGHIQAPGP